MAIKKKRYKIMWTGVALLIVFLLLWHPWKKEIWEENAELLKEKILAVESTEISLTDVTPFEWDRAYSFPPYSDPDTIYQTVGYKWDRVHGTVDEAQNQIVFLKNEKVVCYLYGYPTNNQYGILLNHEGPVEPAILFAENQNRFSVSKEDGVTYLTKKEEL